MERLVEIKATKPFTLYLKYNNGVEGEVNLSGIERKGVFAIWNDINVFEQVKLDTESGAPTWSEDLDLDPLNLYLMLIGKTFEEYKSSKNQA